MSVREGAAPASASVVVVVDDVVIVAAAAAAAAAEAEGTRPFSEVGSSVSSSSNPVWVLASLISLCCQKYLLPSLPVEPLLPPRSRALEGEREEKDEEPAPPACPLMTRAEGKPPPKRRSETRRVRKFEPQKKEQRMERCPEERPRRVDRATSSNSACDVEALK